VLIKQKPKKCSDNRFAPQQLICRNMVIRLKFANVKKIKIMRRLIPFQKINPSSCTQRKRVFHISSSNACCLNSVPRSTYLVFRKNWKLNYCYVRTVFKKNFSLKHVILLYDIFAHGLLIE